MQEKEINLIDYWNIIWKKRKFIVITVIVVTIISVGISLILPKWYKATAVMMPPATEEGQFGGLGANLSAFGLGGILGGGEDQMRIVAILKSKKMLELLDEKYDFQTKYNKKFKFQTYKELKSNVRIEIGEEEQISVSLFDQDQEMVAEMTNYIVHCLDSLNISLSTSKANNNRIFVENRIQMTMDSLSLFENETAQFMKNNNIISLSEQLKAEVEKAADMKAQIMEKEVELDIKKSLLTGNNQEIKNFEITLCLLKEKYNEFFNSANPDKLFLNLENVPDLQKQYAQLRRKVVYFSKLLEYLGPQYEQARIEEAKDVPTIQVIDKAKRPEWKYKPKRALIVIFTFVFSIFIVALFIVLKKNYENINKNLN